MQKFPPSSDAVTLVISEVVEPSRIQDYEVWTKGFNQAAQQFEGFLGVEIIRPRDHLCIGIIDLSSNAVNQKAVAFLAIPPLKETLYSQDKSHQVGQASVIS